MGVSKASRTRLRQRGKAGSICMLLRAGPGGLAWGRQGPSPARLGVLGRRNDQDRAVRVVSDLGGRRAAHQPGEIASAVPAEDEHVSVAAGVDEFVDRQAVYRLDRDRL